MKTSAIDFSDQPMSKVLSGDTAGEHRKLEQALSLLFVRGSSTSEWRWYFERMFGVHAAIESQLWSGEWCRGLNPSERARKGEWLRHDLEKLGLGVQGIEALPRMPLRSDSSIEDRWGTAWVLEGSMLGNRALSAMAPPALQGTMFLAGYGDRTGELWRSFRERLDAAARDGLNSALVVQAATNLFRDVGRWLGPPVGG